MQIYKSVFTDEEISLLFENGISFMDDYDYSDDEIIEIEEQIINLMLHYGFDKSGEPTSQVEIWETIFDKYQDKFDPPA